MSGQASGQATDSSLPIPIPPIEIGSFVAPRPDKSEFIGSASGIFFANTVFRSFATLLPASSQGPSDETGRSPMHSDGQRRVHVTNPQSQGAPDSAHDYVLASENLQEQRAEEAAIQASLNTAASNFLGQLGTQESSTLVRPAEGPSYRIAAPGIGLPPSAAVARDLLVQYFKKWHPFFPFLHGPTFFDQVDGFYNQNGSVPLEEQQDIPGIRTRMIQAVTFQCVFNIAADSSAELPQLDDSSRISSTTALTNLLGVVSSGHDLPSLQALLAVEVYLIKRMALRAASTVHGTLTRILYHCGLHRCPFRYIQLSRDACDIRQRIFWCAYILDRQLSLLLGHPPAIKDTEVDVCIPGMAELHNPVKACQPQSNDSPLAQGGDEITAHLPRGHTVGRASAASTRYENETGHDASPVHAHEANINSIEAESPTRHHKTAPREAGEFVLGYLVRYSRLCGVAFDLFHTSIHNRYVTWDQVLDLSSRIQSWWNGLPLTLQENNSQSSCPTLQFSSYFMTMYQYLVLFVNRSPLSLPTYRIEFRSSIQSALSASRAIVRSLRSPQVQDHPALFAWPTTLSATWMAGLVIAFASLLNLYPFHKARNDMNDVLSILNIMAQDWTSARHCRAALNSLLSRLTSRTSAEISLDKATPSSRGNSLIHSQTIEEATQPAEEPSSVRNKRRKYTLDIGQNSTKPSGNIMYERPSIDGPLSEVVTDRHPVLQYSGPDFGFDSASASAYQGGWETMLDQNLGLEASGQFFDGAEWEMYMQNFGDRFGL